MLTVDNNYNVIVHYEDGTELSVYSNQLHNKQLDYWQGWQCNAGFDRIVIDENLKVYSSECRNNYLGEVLKDFEIPNGPTRCNKERCTGCTADLALKKQSNK